VNRLFVYGTLMSGQERAEMLGGVSSVVAASTFGRLYHLRYGYPALIDVEDGRAHGELVTVEDLEARLSALDAYEGDLYRRVRRTVALDGDETAEAWCYVVDVREEPRLVADGAIRVWDGRWVRP
jgi:gamma-glutamylcyclotransferase (GGCT)/AIG2-like uncharacterized protein YtfP